MDLIIYLAYILSFVIGMIVGLLLSYKKYTEPFVSKNIDLVALVISIIGWILFLNSQFITLIPQYISITVGLFFVATVLGMRPGYGRYELAIGFIVSGLIWLVGMVLL
ncbi:MAG: energy-converting hydrogenase subunit EhaL family protein [Methanobacterium sp.]|jgi:energy-converting hydrogenase A subunit L|uniref:energy-converting hydrogenase subunit EhaL family protein n=1 Tax=Methanobacterium sp. MBAC-LM TaxID=3412034 RepID=UPI00320E7F7C